MTRKSFQVQGHRGARGLRPADTLAGFEYALDLGISALEMDAVMTRDEVIVLAHDAYINPKIHSRPDGAPIPSENDRGPLIRDLTLAQVKEYDTGSIALPDFPRRVRVPGERIPSLRDLLIYLTDREETRVDLCLELKYNPELDDTAAPEAMIDRILRDIREFQVEDRFIFQCFDLRVLEICASRLDTGRALFLADDETLPARQGKASPWTNGLMYEPGGGILDFLAAAPKFQVFAPRFDHLYKENEHYLGNSVDEIQDAGYQVIPWTVNEEADMERLMDMGVDGIMSDYPDTLLALCRQREMAVRNVDD